MMLDFQQKRKVRSFMYHRVTLCILLVLTLIVLHSTWSVYVKKSESEEMRSISLKNVENLRSRDTELSSKIKRLDTTPGIEEEIRSKFTVAKSNESMVVVVEDVQTSTATTTKPLSFWQKIKAFLR